MSHKEAVEVYASLIFMILMSSSNRNCYLLSQVITEGMLPTLNAANAEYYLNPVHLIHLHLSKGDCVGLVLNGVA